MKKLVTMVMGLMLVCSIGYAKAINANTVDAIVAKAGADGSVSYQLENSANLATKITSPDANTTYIGVAATGTAQASALWQCKKVLVSGTTTTITWADGNTNFDNVATDLTALAYS